MRQAVQALLCDSGFPCDFARDPTGPAALCARRLFVAVAACGLPALQRWGSRGLYFLAVAAAVLAAAPEARSDAENQIVSGIVVYGEDLQRAGGAQIQCVSISTAPRPSSMPLFATAAEDGRFQFQQQSDALLLWASSPDGEQGAVVEVPADATTIRILLRRLATLVGRLLDREGNPLAGYEVSAVVRVPLDQHGSFRNCFDIASKCDEQGRFELSGLVVGQNYHISVLFDSERHATWTAAELIPERPGVIELGDYRLPRQAAWAPASGLELWVVDSQGHPVGSFEAMLYTHGGFYTDWRQGRQGRLYFNRNLWQGGLGGRDELMDLLIRAEGFAPTMLAVDEADTAAPKKITLLPAQQVIMNLHASPGIELPPNLQPDVYYLDHCARVRVMRQPENSRPNRRFEINFSRVRPLGSGRFQFELPAEERMVCVSIDHPGFLQRYEAGPFSTQELASGQLDLELPPPAAVRLRLKGADGPADQTPFASSRFNLYWAESSAATSLHSVAWWTVDGQDPEWGVQGLAPGHYRAYVRTVPNQLDTTRDPQPNPGAFRDFHQFTLEPGELREVPFQYVPFDPNAFRGEHSATIRILQAGQPASGMPFRITYGARHYGELLVREGSLPPGGEIHLDQIAGGDEDAGYRVRIEGEYLGGFTLGGPQRHREFDFQLPPKAGDAAPDILMLDPETLQPVMLSSYRGKAVYLEFWATWCGPCQVPMAQLNDVWQRRRGDWEGKAALLALSIDSDVAKLTQHVQQRGWTSLRHFWAGSNENGFDAAAARQFVVSGVPTAMLINPQGVIVWRGHPTQCDVELAIDQELASR